MYRLWATAPQAWDNANPHHVLWNVWQMAIANLAYSLGHPTTVTFQVVGILTGCAVLFFFYVFLRKTLDNRFFAGAAVLFLAFTPAFWFVTLQNHPYPLALLFLVFYFLCWQSREGDLPSTWRLVAAGACLSAASLFHQAVILLILPAAVVLAYTVRKTAERGCYALRCGQPPSVFRFSASTSGSGKRSIRTTALYDGRAAMRKSYIHHRFFKWVCCQCSRAQSLDFRDR